MMPRKRAYIGWKTKCASALLALGHIPHERAKELTAEQIIGHYQFHHYPIPHAAPYNGPDLPWNLVPQLVAEHDYITNKNNGTGRSDKTMIARTRRILKERKRAKQKRKIPSRPFQKGHRPLRSRGFQRKKA